MKSLITSLIILITSANLHAQTTTDALYQTACDLPDTLAIETRINAFKQVLKADKKHALTHYQLANLYAACNTVNDRQRARKHIEQAIRLEPDNIDFQLALGDLLWQQAHWNEAEAQYQKAFQLDTLNSDVAYKIGATVLDSYLKFIELEHLDMIEGLREAKGRDGNTLHIFYWDHYGKDDLKRATAFLNKCIQIDPKYRNAYYKIGLAYYESRHPEKLIEISGQLLKHIPGDKNALLFCGLGFQAINQLSRAHAAFTAALNRMDVEERAMMENIDLIADHQTADQIQQSEAQLANQTYATDARSLFWQKQDPLRLTEYNERRMAHYGRVAYANLRYSRPDRNIAGWQTDMGQAYIKYGRPLKRQVKRTEEKFKFGMKGRISTELVIPEAFPFEFEHIGTGIYDNQSKANLQIERWHYENFTLEFVSADGRNGRLTSSTPETPRYVDPYKNQKYTTPHQILAFKEPDGVRLEIAYALPANRFQSQASTLDDGLFIFEPSGREIDKQTHRSTVQWHKPRTRWDQHHILTRQIHLSPGDYDILIEARDQKTGAIATFRETRSLTSTDSTLSMSDLYLARRIQEKTPFPESRADLSILPNPIRTYSPSDPVYVYLELYNLTRNDFGRTRFDIAYHISTPDKDEIDPTLFIDQDLARPVTVEAFLNETIIQPEPTDSDDPESSLNTRRTISRANVEYRVKYILPKSRETDQLKRATQEGVQMATSVTAEYEGDKTNDFTYLQFDVSQLPKGIHKLTVTVSDRFANTQTQQHTLFRVVE